MKSCLTCALFNPRTTVLSTTEWPGSGFFLHPLLFSVTLFSLQLQPRSASFQFDQLLLLLPLTHSLTHFNPSNATIHHLLKTSSLCSAAHHCRHQHHQEVSLPLSASSDYTLSLSVGPPNSPTTIQLYMDTGSDLVYFPYSPFECILCEGKETPSTSLSPPPLSPTGPISSPTALLPAPPPTPTSPPSTSAPSPAAPLTPSRQPPRAPRIRAPTFTMPMGTTASSLAFAATPSLSGLSASQISPSLAPTSCLPSLSASLALAAPVSSPSPPSLPPSPLFSPPTSPTTSSPTPSAPTASSAPTPSSSIDPFYSPVKPNQTPGSSTPLSSPTPSTPTSTPSPSSLSSSTRPAS